VNDIDAHGECADSITKTGGTVVKTENGMVTGSTGTPDHTQHAAMPPAAPEPAPTSVDEAAPTHAGKAMPMPADKAMPAGKAMPMLAGKAMTGHAGKAMSMPGDKAQMEHQGAQWPHFANMVLGLWLMTGAFALEFRSTALQVSDLVSGALIIVLAILSLTDRAQLKFWSPWVNSLIGVWLLFAPLLFWAPTAAVYANDTLVGALVVVFAILAPGMPMPAGMKMEPGPDVPPGWSYNPSSWPQRAPIIALALVGFLLSRYMTSYQFDYIGSIWDPFFVPGTSAVLKSALSKSFPISDAGLGAVAYMIEFLMGFMGDKRRWRTMPWMVTFFGILVVPLGIVSITLIVMQPLVVGAWCTPCLIAAAAMVIMIALTLDEVVAMIQFLVQAVREGQPLWKTFWMGGTLRDLPVTPPPRPDVVSAEAMIWGVALPWNLLLSAGLGVWLMFAPSALGITGGAAHSDHLIGALIVTVAVIALADVGRALRFINVLFGAWVIAAPWLLGGATPISRWSDAIVAAVLILLSLPPGPVRERYGTWQRFIR